MRSPQSPFHGRSAAGCLGDGPYDLDMRIPLFQVDAFASRPFTGNPAAVCPLEGWLPDATLQAIAAENNLSETAFLVPGKDGYELRWFTPLIEVDLCGHATLAAGKVVLDELQPGADSVRFDTKSGELRVDRRDGLLELDFPSQPGAPIDPPQALIEALGGAPQEVLRSTHYDVVVYGSEAEVRVLTPDIPALREHDRVGVTTTAPGDEVDFVSRFFAPLAGVDEDPVTGSAHCALAPYWADRTGSRVLRARQISSRGGELRCELRGDRIGIAGDAVLVLVGELRIPVA